MRLTGLLQEIADEIGEQEALALADAVGGKLVWIPKTATEDHWLAKTIGLEAAQQLCSYFLQENSDGKTVGRLRVLMPLGPAASVHQNRLLARKALASGMSARDTALLVCLHERTIWRLRASMRAEGLLAPAPKRAPSNRVKRHSHAREALLAGSSIREVAKQFGLREKTLVRMQADLGTKQSVEVLETKARVEWK